MAAGVTDPKTIEVANSQVSAETPAAPSSPEDLSFLNAEPDEFDRLPPPKAKPETAAAPAPEVVTPPVAPAIAHPAALVDAARMLGMDDRHIKVLDTDSLFDLVLKMGAKAAPAEPVRRQEPLPPPPPPAKDESDPILDALEEEGHDKRLLTFLRNERKEKAELKEALKQRAQADMHRQRNQSYEAVDGAIESLGPKFEKFVGKGGIDQVTEPQKARRMRVFTSAGIDLLNDSPRQIKSKITQAALELFSDLVDATAPTSQEVAKSNGQPRISADAWDKAALPKPTNTKPTMTRGESAALAAKMRDYMVEHNINHHGDEFEGLPD